MKGTEITNAKGIAMIIALANAIESTAYEAILFQYMS